MFSRVLIIEDSLGLGDSARGLLERQGFIVEKTPPTEEAVATANDLQPDLILLVLSDHVAEALRWVRTVSWIHASPVLVLMQKPSADLAREVTRLPYVADILRKPVPVPWLLSAVERAIVSRDFIMSGNEGEGYHDLRRLGARDVPLGASHGGWLAPPRPSTRG